MKTSLLFLFSTLFLFMSLSADASMHKEATVVNNDPSPKGITSIFDTVLSDKTCFIISDTDVGLYEIDEISYTFTNIATDYIKISIDVKIKFKNQNTEYKTKITHLCLRTLNYKKTTLSCSTERINKNDHLAVAN